MSEKNIFMDYNQFNYSLDMGHPPDEYSEPLKAMWWERKGEWEKAHSIVQAESTETAAWVHAYLHRKEGDDSNASFWYKSAKKDFPDMDLKEESIEIVKNL